VLSPAHHHHHHRHDHHHVPGAKPSSAGTRITEKRKTRTRPSYQQGAVALMVKMVMMLSGDPSTSNTGHHT